MFEARSLLKELGYVSGDAYDLPSSQKRFKDGAQYRVELASIEGPAAVDASLEALAKAGLTAHRLSQGSGLQMSTDVELVRMLDACRSAGVELSSFPGPRGTWTPSPSHFTSTMHNLAYQAEGMDRVVHVLEDVARGLELGVRGLTIADRGVIRVLNEGRKRGIVPADLVMKASAMAGLGSNPLSALEAEEIGVDSLNVPTALSLPQLAAIRAAVDVPIDLYVEAPDSFGGFIRTYEIPEIIRVAAPVVIKVGLRNAPDLYPSGIHLEQEAVNAALEKVHRLETIKRVIDRYYPEAVASQAGAEDLGIPQPVL
ncbi:MULTISPECIES: hypothetical protein [unclassified Pseudarthrobacter]|uniref:hypothetical protein n=1 Tax=unclassified Pseudarthrobacter TaxID=2647000 RepID=UPI0030783DBC